MFYLVTQLQLFLFLVYYFELEELVVIEEHNLDYLGLIFVISSGYSNDDLKDIKERVKKEEAKNELQEVKNRRIKEENEVLSLLNHKITYYKD